MTKINSKNDDDNLSFYIKNIEKFMNEVPKAPPVAKKASEMSKYKRRKTLGSGLSNNKLGDSVKNSR